MSIRTYTVVLNTDGGYKVKRVDADHFSVNDEDTWVNFHNPSGKVVASFRAYKVESIYLPDYVEAHND